MIESICQNCGNKKMFSDDKDGKKYKCPNCNEIVTIQSIGTAITAEHQANVTDVYADSITKAEHENKRAEQQKQYEKLVRKSKTWNGWGIAFLIFAGIGLIMVFSEDKSQIISVIFWGGLGLYFKRKSKEFKENADAFYNEIFLNTSPSSPEPIVNNTLQKENTASAIIEPNISISKPIEESEQTTAYENVIDYPTTKSNKNGYIILTIAIIAIGIWFLFQREQTSTNQTAKTDTLTKIQNADNVPIQNDTILQTNNQVSEKANITNENTEYTNYTVSNNKAYFYNTAIESARRNAYLAKDDIIQACCEQNGFVWTTFTNNQGKKSEGWIKLQDLLLNNSASQNDRNLIVDSSTTGNTTYTEVDIKPSFPGGDEEYNNYINEHFNWNNTQLNGKPYRSLRVVVDLIIDKNGYIRNVKPVSNIGYGMEDEFIRVIKSLPKWTPAQKNGKPVNYHSTNFFIEF